MHGKAQELSLTPTSHPSATQRHLRSIVGLCWQSLKTTSCFTHKLVKVTRQISGRARNRNWAPLWDLRVIRGSE